MAGADHSAVVFRKSSYSESGNCVEVGIHGDVSAVLIRDSKDPDGGILSVSPTTWKNFLQEIQHGRSD